MKLPALMYHDVIRPGQDDASGFADLGAASYKLEVAQFTAHLDALAATGLRFGSILDRGGCDAALTFDDGGASAVHAAEALAVRGMIGHFLITTARIDTPAFVRREDIRALHAAGHVIGSHSHTHPPDIARLDDAALGAEWRDSTACLADILGAAVTVASVPGGFHSRRVGEAAAAAGIEYLFTSEPDQRLRQRGACQLIGRYALRRDSPASLAVALACGRGLAQQRQWLLWNAKKPLKRWARPVYQGLRRHLLGREPGA